MLPRFELLNIIKRQWLFIRRKPVNPNSKGTSRKNQKPLKLTRKKVLIITNARTYIKCSGKKSTLQMANESLFATPYAE